MRALTHPPRKTFALRALWAALALAVCRADDDDPDAGSAADASGLDASPSGDAGLGDATSDAPDAREAGSACECARPSVCGACTSHCGCCPCSPGQVTRFPDDPQELECTSQSCYVPRDAG